MKTESIAIANLSCGGCVNTITKKLNNITGVEKVGVDL
jgi:copper chaperone CopZ